MKQISNLFLSLFVAAAGWFVTNGLLQLITHWAFSQYDDATQIVQMLSTQNKIWALCDFALRLGWCGIAGLLVLRGPVNFCGTRLVIVGWGMAIVALIEASMAPNGASAVYLIWLMWFVPVCTFLGGLMAIRDKLHRLDALRRGSAR